MARVRALIEPQLLVIPQTNAALNMAADRLAFLDIQDQALLGTSGVHDLSGCVCASAKSNGRPLARVCDSREATMARESRSASRATLDGRRSRDLDHATPKDLQRQLYLGSRERTARRTAVPAQRGARDRPRTGARSHDRAR